MIDIHSHNPGADRLLSVDLATEALPAEGQSFSAGFHPWTLTGNPEQGRLLLRDAIKRGALAVGECGLDKRRGPSIAFQKAWLKMQLEEAARSGLPVILHIVAAWPELMESTLHTPHSTLIIHGFRGKPELARQLLNHGFYLSLGALYNPAAEAIIPDNRLLVETDESSFLPTLSPARLAAAVRNANTLFPASR